MAGLTELQALTTSIGEYTVATLGADKLRALRVALNTRDLCAFVMISLSDPSDESQRRVIADMLDIERLYADEVAMEFVFMDEIPEPSEEMASTPQYSHA